MSVSRERARDVQVIGNALGGNRRVIGKVLGVSPKRAVAWAQGRGTMTAAQARAVKELRGEMTYMRSAYKDAQKPRRNARGKFMPKPTDEEAGEAIHDTIYLGRRRRTQEDQHYIGTQFGVLGTTKRPKSYKKKGKR